MKIRDLRAIGPITQARQNSCCGGSAMNFGGCSTGSPQKLFNPEENEYISSAGDTCSGANLGGAAGGVVFISA